jgi:hypothetical protein
VSAPKADYETEPYCALCDHNRHICPGCGIDVDHDEIACEACRALP